jgi:hypothetical protein
MTDPAKINVSLDLDALFVEPAELDGDPVDVRTLMRRAVVDQAARRLVAGFDHDELHEMRQEMQRVRSELVRERLAAEVAAAMDLPVQRTSRWGEKKGDPVTIRELIRQELEAFLNGTQTSRPRDSYDKTPNNLRELIGVVANETMRGEMGSAVMEARKVVAARVQEILTTKIAAELVRK